MNPSKKKSFCVLRTALLCALLLLTVLGISACKSSSSPTIDRITSLTVNQDGSRIEAKAELSAQTLQAHQDEQILLYALMPDESADNLNSKKPIAQCDIEHSPSLSIELDSSNVWALYSAYALVTEDGTVLNQNLQYISNLPSLAKQNGQLLWQNAQKGLCFDDASSAAALGCMLGMTEMRLSTLLGASGIGESIEASLDAQALADLDKAIGDGAGNNMQISLHLIFDRRISFSQCTALLDFLVSRYNESPTYSLGSLYISTDASYTAKDTASLAHIASMVLSRHRSSGEVYIVCSASTLLAQKLFFSEILLAVDELGGFTWGAAVIPTLPDDMMLWEADAQIRREENKDGEKSELCDLMLPTRLSKLTSQLKSYEGTYPSSFVLCELYIPYDNAQLRAVSFAYAYAHAIADGADAVYYGAHWDDKAGVHNADGSDNKMTAFFSSIDTGLFAEQNYICSSTIGEEWSKLSGIAPVRKEVSGTASLQKPDGALSTLIDFSDKTLSGFATFQKAEEPTVRNSASWSSPVLSTWMEQPTAYSGAGVGRSFNNTPEMKNTLALSVRVLLQGTAEESPILRMRLWGTDRTGDHLTYSAQQTISEGTWQTVTFSVASFFSELDTAHPYTVTLEVLGGKAIISAPTEGEEGDDTVAEATDDAFVFWMKDILLRRPESNRSRLLPVLLITGGVVGVFAVTVCIYYFVASRRRRR